MVIMPITAVTNFTRGNYFIGSFDVFLFLVYAYIFTREVFPAKEKHWRDKAKKKYWQVYYTYKTPTNQSEKLKMFARLNGFKHRTTRANDGSTVTTCVLH